MEIEKNRSLFFVRGNFVDNQNSGVTDIYSYQEYQAAADIMDFCYINASPRVPLPQCSLFTEFL